MMRNFYLSLLVPAVIVLSGCNAINRKYQQGSAVEVNGKHLYYSTLDSLTLGFSGEDSIRIAKQFISQWAKDILMYDKAKARTTANIERLVEDYRRALYVHAYEEYLVERYMPKVILDSTITHIYEQSNQFLLDESIIKGLLLVYPNDAPKTQQLKQWTSRIGNGEAITAEEMDQIEKYAYQNASGYELFTDRWLTTSDILKYIPIERADLEKAISKHNQIELSDSTKTYLLQLNAKYLKGEKMPLEYAEPEIKKLILNQRQYEFLQKERERIYNDAIQQQKIIFYDK